MVVLVSDRKQPGIVSALRTLRENIAKFMLVSEEFSLSFKMIIMLMIAGMMFYWL